MNLSLVSGSFQVMALVGGGAPQRPILSATPLSTVGDFMASFSLTPAPRWVERTYTLPNPSNPEDPYTVTLRLRIPLTLPHREILAQSRYTGAKISGFQERIALTLAQISEDANPERREQLRRVGRSMLVGVEEEVASVFGEVVQVVAGIQFQEADPAHNPGQSLYEYGPSYGAGELVGRVVADLLTPSFLPHNLPKS